MGSYETPTHRGVFNEIVLTDTALISGVPVAHISGRILVSGVKLYIDDGTDLKLIESA